VKPTVLVAATVSWISSARLALALADSGCRLEAVCPPRHPLGKASSQLQMHTYNGLTPLKSFAAAIAAAKPDLLVPSDDLATQHLHDLYRQEQHAGRVGGEVCMLIERSLGAPESFPVVCDRNDFIKLARDEGILVPRTEVIASIDDLRNWVARMGFPTVLKANRTSGGEGVRVAHTLEEAERAFCMLEAPPLFARAVKRALVDQDLTLVRPVLARRRSMVNGQAFVAGREATSLVACWKGAVLAGLHFEVLNKQYSAGPATVLRVIEHSQMSTAAERIVRRLSLSGLHGLDFMLEANTGNAYLIEINPRATQVGHLRLGPGRDLPAALYAAVSGQVVQEAPKITEKDIITLFPQEWIRNPKSAFLRSGYHDVPWEEPGLVRACVRRRRHWSAWYSKQRWFQAFSEVRHPRL
jgi:hypothetical protein